MDVKVCAAGLDKKGKDSGSVKIAATVIRSHMKKWGWLCKGTHTNLKIFSQ